MHKKILLLGSGELGKELVIALKRLGQIVVAVDIQLLPSTLLNVSVSPEFKVNDVKDHADPEIVVEA